MTGDQADMVRRLRSLLPAHWFPDDAPVLASLLNGLGSAWAWFYGGVAYVGFQLRIGTASESWLDLIASDLFGRWIRRRRRETDDHLRSRILAELLRERGTRAGLRRALLDLTGREPVIFEPALPSDTGAYGTHRESQGGLAYGVAGGWGSLSLPFQCLVTAYRPHGTGIASVSGWCCPGGAYGQGAIEYANLALMEDLVPDAEILETIARTMPVAATAWTRLSD